MSVRNLLIAASIATLTGCAALTPPAAIECSPPPALPEAVRKQADQQQETFSSRGSGLLRFFEMLIERSPR
jgi:hypothetical protein